MYNEPNFCVPLGLPIQPASCSTITGPDQSAECSFPFNFADVSWTGCTTADEPADNPQPWCVTQTDENGNPPLDENGQFTTWGYCHSSCPVDQGLINKLFPLHGCFYKL